MNKAMNEKAEKVRTGTYPGKESDIFGLLVKLT